MRHALLLFSLFISPAHAAEPSITLVEGALDPLVCITSGTLLVRDESLDGVLFSARRADPVKMFQGWGDVKKTKVVDGVTHAYVKLQFPRQAGTNIGWVAEAYIKNRAECAGLGTVAPPAETPRPITGINDPNCCEFPLANRPKLDYTRGTPSFGSSRSGGARVHAAADLYREKGDLIRAVTDGQVIRGLYLFYQGSYAIELKHSGGFVVRYGEIGSKVAVTQGQTVRGGATVGYMGKPSCCAPQLHFELYSGAKTGKLSVSGNKYGRRADIMNPTTHLQKWQENEFRDYR